MTVSAQASAAAAGIRTRPAPTCVVCGGAGHERHAGLVDRLFGAPGTWRLVGCGSEGCGLLWLDPTPLAEDLGLAYQAYYTHASPTHAGWRRAVARWIKQGHFASRFGYRIPAAAPKRLLAAAVRWNTNLCDAMDKMVFFLEPLAGGRVLDVGCGDGHSLAELRELGWEVEGVDFDPLAAKAAEARGIRVRVGSLEAQGYPDATFDAVTMSHLIEHVPDPVAFLAECRRVLKPEGRLVAVTPNVDSLGHARFGRDWRGLEPPRHLQIFSAAALERAARRAGLAVRTLRTLAGGARFIHAQSRQIAGAPASAADAWRFEREERSALRDRPWVGEELLLVAGRG